MLLYVILFFIMLGLFLASLVKRRKGRRSMEDTSVPGRKTSRSKEGTGGQG
jgi:hypothetical protein